MARAIISRDFDYVLREERELPEAEQTTFHLRKMTSSERAQLDDEMAKINQADGTFVARVGTMNLTTVRACLIGWSNFKDEDGADVSFELQKGQLNVLGKNRRVASWKCVDMLSYAWITEIALEVRGESNTTVEEAGN